MTDAELDRLASFLLEGETAGAASAVLAECRRARAAEAALKGSPMADDVAAEIEARLAKATPGPWTFDAMTTSHVYAKGEVLATTYYMAGQSSDAAIVNAHLIAKAPADLAALLADRRYSRFLVADKLEESALAAEERRAVVAWLRARADEYRAAIDECDGSDATFAAMRNKINAVECAIRDIEAGRHVRPQQGEGGP